MRAALIAVLAHEAGQMQVSGRERERCFLVRLAAGAGVRRFAEVGIQFAAAGTPQAEIGFLRALQQEHVIALVENVEQRRDFVGQRHRRE